MFIKTAASRQR